MLEIKNDSIVKIEGGYKATCICGKHLLFKNKSSALKMLNNGSCRSCKRDYRNVGNNNIEIYKTEKGWTKRCSGCDCEQSYTRKDHAKQSFLNDWQCKKCFQRSKSFEGNAPVGDKQRMYNKFHKSAINRGIEWNLTLDDMYKSFNGTCNMTGWNISISYSNQTASLDRIDSSKGYTVDNIQWVHTMVNMCKNKYDNHLFIDMCKAIANKVRW